MTDTRRQNTEGLLWCDWDGVGVENTLPEAIAAFQRRFGRRPTLIQLPVGTVDRAYRLDGLRVVPVENCPPRHAMLYRVEEGQD